MKDLEIVKREYGMEEREMDLPKIDKRTKEDLISHIKNQLSSYVPEWRFDRNNPDAGTALALIYADMMSETIYRFNQVLEKNKMMFFEKIGAKLLPAIPANGYITFSLVNEEVEAVAVKRGEKLLADTKEGEEVVFETVHDVYVTPAKPDCLYLCNKELDYIGMLLEEQEMASCTLFDLKGMNLQEHILYFSHSSILNIKNEAWVYCSFVDGVGKFLPEPILREFINQQNVIFEYYSEKGFVPFSEIKIEFGQIALKKEEGQPIFSLLEQDGVESYWVRCKVKDIKPFEQIKVKAMILRSEGENIVPASIYAKGVDQKIREFFPFGERASLYDEAYFISDEVFGKKGASVTMEFELDFLKLPLEVQEIESEINWKAIMKRSDIKVDMEYDISIAEVIWEYYNGEGFKRLFLNEQYSDVFGIQEGTHARRVTIHFKCPMDLEPVLVNSNPACCIRARVLKMNNLYKVKGQYISPLVSHLRLSYEYIQDNLTPEYFLAKNNMEQIIFKNKTMATNEIEFYPFIGRKEDVSTLYMGFKNPPIGAPIKMLFSMEETLLETMPQLHYEYYSKKGWRTLTIVDETQNFRKTGIVTIIGNSDFEKSCLFQKERYWIKITDINHEYYQKMGKQPLQKLQGIYMNTTQIKAIETKEPELFSISIGEENKTCQLKETQIYELEVWVNEYRTIHKEEMTQLEQQRNIRYEYEKDGQIKEVWVKWQEVKAFSNENPDARHYVADYINGTIVFPNGTNGKIPTSDENPTILVLYRCGGGEIGNLPKHSIQRLNRTIGFIGDVDNYEITTGGCNQEQVNEALERNAKALLHGYRAVTIRDYEALAYEPTRNICKVKCFSNRNQFGTIDYGHITLVVLQKNYENGKKYFDTIRTQMMDYMKHCISPQLLEQQRFHIVEPEFIELSAIITLEVTEYNQIFDVRSAILSRMEEFLNPMTGNYNNQGWEIGVVPNGTQIMNALKEIDSIHYIENVRLIAYKNSVQGKMELDLDKVFDNHYALPVNGIHEIVIKVKE